MYKIRMLSTSSPFLFFFISFPIYQAIISIRNTSINIQYRRKYISLACLIMHDHPMDYKDTCLPFAKGNKSTTPRKKRKYRKKSMTEWARFSPETRHFRSVPSVDRTNTHRPGVRARIVFHSAGRVFFFLNAASFFLHSKVVFSRISQPKEHSVSIL